MFLVGILVSGIMNLLVPFDNPNHAFYHDLIICIFCTVLIWEGSLRLDNRLNTLIPWVTHARKRVSVQFSLTLIYSSIAVYFPVFIYKTYVCPLPPEKEKFILLVSLVVGILVTLVIMGIEVGSQFLKNWKNSLVEVEKYKTQSYQAQLQNLRDQVNPHFLFNNLSVLTSLVYKDQDKAADFINQLSKVYRYVLESKDTELVPLDKEMDFIGSYIYLLQIRFDKNLNVVIDKNESVGNVFLPPMSLQILVENTIKHNEVSEEHPLTVQITIRKHELEISNNIRERQVLEASSGTGLKNLNERFAFYTNRKVNVSNDGQKFTVTIPLLPKFEAS